MDLVDKEQGPPSIPRLDGSHADCLPDIGDRTLDSAQLDEAALGPACNHAGQTRLSSARRAVEDHRGEAIGLDGTAQEFPLTEDVALTDIFLECSRPHPGR